MKWAFIYTLDDPSEPQRIDRIGTLVCVGVSRVSDAADVVRRLIEEGVELIELCGGFGGAGLGAVVEAAQGRVPVGAVFYGVEASAGLQRLFGPTRAI
jgi:predicted polyphosphate/ATP-dependent NAD kinase